MEESENRFSKKSRGTDFEREANFVNNSGLSFSYFFLPISLSLSLTHTHFALLHFIHFDLSHLSFFLSYSLMPILISFFLRRQKLFYSSNLVSSLSLSLNGFVPALEVPFNCFVSITGLGIFHQSVLHSLSLTYFQ